MSIQEKLEPCPFCGNSDVAIYDAQPPFGVECLQCEILGPSVNHSGNGEWNDTEAHAIKAWNTRASGWISVEDKTPNTGQLVLVSYTTPNDYSGYAIAGHCGNGVFDFGPIDSDLKSDVVTHWQPLPEPPEHFVDANKKVGGDD